MILESPTSGMEMRVMPEKRTRGLDPMAGVTFGSMKKRYDVLGGDGFGAQKRSNDDKLRNFLRKNEMMSAHQFDRHITSDREQPTAFMLPKKPAVVPYPYYMSYAPVYYRLKDKGM